MLGVKTQGLVAISSGVSELYGTAKATPEGLGIQSLPKDLGRRLKGHAWGGASAALGIVNRKGLGNVRHLDTNFLWIQCVAAQRAMGFYKVLGADDPADLFTKYLDWSTSSKHCIALECGFAAGRAAPAPELISTIVRMASEATSHGLW